MNTPTTSPQTRKRSPLLLAAGGCAVIAACLVLAFAANAVYWIARTNGGSAAQPVPVEQVQAGWEALPEGDPAAGAELFESENCQACHSLDAGEQRAGPALAGMGERAADTVAGYSAGQYLYESIVHPRAHQVPGYPGGIMPADYGEKLSEQELADLIAFLLSR